MRRRYFGTDAITFTATTNDSQARGVTRTFTSLDADFGRSSGKSVADFVFSTQLRPAA